MTQPAVQQRIGIIGIGAMGLPMARNLQRRGLAPCVRDIDPAAEAAARALGLRVCASPAELAASCDVVVVVVVDAGQINEVLFGRDGVAAAAPGEGGARPVVVLCSTIGPVDMELFAVRLAFLRIDMVDAPISGGPDRAETGTMSMMVAARQDVFARCESVLRSMAASLYLVGERIGDGARTKLVNNLLAGVNLVAGAEAFALGTRLGLDRKVLFEVVKASSGSSWVFVDRMTRALEDDYAPRARTRILTKDVGLALAMAAEAGAPVPLGTQALEVFQLAVEAGFGDLDDASVVKTYLPDF